MGLTMPSHRQQFSVAVWLRNDFATAVLDADVVLTVYETTLPVVRLHDCDRVYGCLERRRSVCVYTVDSLASHSHSNALPCNRINAESAAAAAAAAPAPAATCLR